MVSLGFIQLRLIKTISIVKNIKSILQNRGQMIMTTGRVNIMSRLIHTRLALLDESENGKQPEK